MFTAIVYDLDSFQHSHMLPNFKGAQLISSRDILRSKNGLTDVFVCFLKGETPTIEQARVFGVVKSMQLVEELSVDLHHIK